MLASRSTGLGELTPESPPGAWVAQPLLPPPVPSCLDCSANGRCAEENYGIRAARVGLTRSTRRREQSALMVGRLASEPGDVWTVCLFIYINLCMLGGSQFRSRTRTWAGDMGR